MQFLPMAELMRNALEDGYAVPAFCVWNAETVQSTLRVAEKMRAPVILMAGPGEFPLLAPAAMARVARAVAEDFDVRAALHLDHGESLQQVDACLQAGFTSVMLDYSARPFAENVAAMQRAVAAARPAGATVEGEIGAVGRVEAAGAEGNSRDNTLTDPEDATRYVELTRVDALAVSIGNAHGNYTALPQLDFERLAAIRRRVNLPLVLHGGSGTPDHDIHHAIDLGIAKVNVASALIRAMRESLSRQWNEKRNPWVPQALATALPAAERIAAEWIVRVRAEGHAV